MNQGGFPLKAVEKELHQISSKGPFDAWNT
jgi:hypothetical protein